MPLINMAELRAGLPRGRRLIGLDPGRKRVGVALSDASLMLASPWGMLPRGKLAPMAARLAALARQEEAGGLVVGFPLDMEGRVGPAAQAARDWALALSDAMALPAALWDERESTQAVHQMLIEHADMGRARRAAVVDAMAAASILQAALDATA